MIIKIERKMKIRLLQSIQAGFIDMTLYPEFLEMDFKDLSTNELKQLHDLMTRCSKKEIQINNQ